MTLPFIVIDQNQLQRADLIAAIVERCRSLDLQLLIPDVSGFEFSNAKNPHQTWRRGLQHIAPNFELVVTSHPMHHIWQIEGESGDTSEIVDHGATEIFKRLLCQIASGDESGLLEMIEGPVKHKMNESLDLWSDPEQFKSAMRTIYDHIKSSMSDATIKALRRTPEDGISDWLSSADGATLIFKGINSRCSSSENALKLTVSPSILGGFVSGMAALALYWLAFGGFDSARAEIISNDLHDLEYAVLGARCHSLATDDKRLKMICNAIKRGTAGREEWFKKVIDRGIMNA